MKKRSPFSSIRELEERIVYGGPMIHDHFVEKELGKNNFTLMRRQG